MNNTETKTAFYAEFPIEFDGREYERITAIINRKQKGEPPIMQLELKTTDGKGVVIAAPDRCTCKLLEESDTASFFKSIIERNKNNVENYDTIETDYEKE